jgi:hypothetical protein
MPTTVRRGQLQAHGDSLIAGNPVDEGQLCYGALVQLGAVMVEVFVLAIAPAGAGRHVGPARVTLHNEQEAALIVSDTRE